MPNSFSVKEPDEQNRYSCCYGNAKGKEDEEARNTGGDYKNT